MLTPSLGFTLYLLAGVSVFFWSEPYRPQSKAAFDHCFQANKLVWVVMILIASCLWPMMLLNMAYRYFFAGRRRGDEDAPR